jgi:ethanolamine utilization protein EutM
MVKNALGLIEVVGLAAGMEAADAAVKAANVELMGYELAKGGGLVVIKVCGDVGAVKAAVDAGAAAAAKINKVYAKHVIPRPHNTLGGIILTKETVGYAPATHVTEAVQPVIEQKAPSEPEAVTLPEPEKIAEETIESPVIEPATEEINEKPVVVSSHADVCNLCGDPACPRKKGDPRVTCIHYDKNKEDE